MDGSIQQQDNSEKRTISQRVPRLSRRQPLTSREQLVRHTIPSILLVSAIFLLFRKIFVHNHQYDPARELISFGSEEQWGVSTTNTTKVALEAHIMSKCPDAKYCLQELVVPAMSKVSDKVDFRLSYIGRSVACDRIKNCTDSSHRIDPDSDDITCMHGPGECLGNIIQLCAQRIYPDPKLFLGFANCMTTHYERIPDRDLVEGCALEHGLDFNRINKCISEEGHGTQLLRDSITRSQEYHVVKSCTVRLEGKVRCVRDGGEWYDCPGGSSVSDLVSQIEEIYSKKE